MAGQSSGQRTQLVNCRLRLSIWIAPVFSSTNAIPRVVAAMYDPGWFSRNAIVVIASFGIRTSAFVVFTSYEDNGRT